MGNESEEKRKKMCALNKICECIKELYEKDLLRYDYNLSEEDSIELDLGHGRELYLTYDEKGREYSIPIYGRYISPFQRKLLFPPPDRCTDMLDMIDSIFEQVEQEIKLEENAPSSFLSENLE